VRLLYASVHDRPTPAQVEPELMLSLHSAQQNSEAQLQAAAELLVRLQVLDSGATAFLAELKARRGVLD
jgi:hypothetical protein